MGLKAFVLVFVPKAPNCNVGCVWRGFVVFVVVLPNRLGCWGCCCVFVPKVPRPNAFFCGCCVLLVFVVAPNPPPKMFPDCCCCCGCWDCPKRVCWFCWGWGWPNKLPVGRVWFCCWGWPNKLPVWFCCWGWPNKLPVGRVWFCCWGWPNKLPGGRVWFCCCGCCCCWPNIVWFCCWGCCCWPNKLLVWFCCWGCCCWPNKFPVWFCCWGCCGCWPNKLLVWIVGFWDWPNRLPGGRVDWLCCWGWPNKLLVAGVVVCWFGCCWVCWVFCPKVPKILCCCCGWFWFWVNGGALAKLLVVPVDDGWVVVEAGFKPKAARLQYQWILEQNLDVKIAQASMGMSTSYFASERFKSKEINPWETLHFSVSTVHNYKFKHGETIWLHSSTSASCYWDKYTTVYMSQILLWSNDWSSLSS